MKDRRVAVETMAEPLLIDFGDDQDETVNTQLSEEKNHGSQKPLIVAVDLAGAILIPGLKIVFKQAKGSLDSSPNHAEGISIGIDRANSSFIVSQQPQIPDSSTYLRLCISLSDVRITDDQGRAIIANRVCNNDISTLVVEVLAAFKCEIIHSSQNKLQQSQNRGLVELMCSLSGIELPKGAIVEVSEVYRDIWGDNNKLVMLAKQLGSDNDSEDKLADAENGTMAASSAEDLWKGLESLEIELEAPPVKKTRRNHDSRQGGLPDTICRRKTEIPTTPKPAARTMAKYPPNDEYRMPTASSESQHVSIGGLEGQMEEQNLRSLEATSKSFWESHGKKGGRQQYGEPNTKFGANETKMGPGGLQTARQYGVSEGILANEVTGWNSFATGHGGVSNKRRGGAGGRGNGRVGAQGGARATRSDNNNPFPLAAKPAGPPKACYNNRTPFGGWDRYKKGRKGQSEGEYVGESSVSFQPGMY